MPARLPTATKATRGTLRDHRVNVREPKPKAGTPRPSRDMPLATKREYDKLVRRLIPTRVLTVVDGLALELAAAAIEEFWRHNAAIQAHGATYETTTESG